MRKEAKCYVEDCQGGLSGYLGYPLSSPSTKGPLRINTVSVIDQQYKMGFQLYEQIYPYLFLESIVQTFCVFL